MLRYKWYNPSQQKSKTPSFNQPYKCKERERRGESRFERGHYISPSSTQWVTIWLQQLTTCGLSPFLLLEHRLQLHHCTFSSSLIWGQLFFTVSAESTTYQVSCPRTCCRHVQRHMCQFLTKNATNIPCPIICYANKGNDSLPKPDHCKAPSNRPPRCISQDYLSIIFFSNYIMSIQTMSPSM